MSEMTLIDELKAPRNDGVVDLGTASEQTRGGAIWVSYPDGVSNWPFLFYF